MHTIKKRVYVAGHRGMVGAAIARALAPCADIDLLTRGHGQLDLTEQAQVRAFFESEQIDEVYLAAARVGGIKANQDYPAEFIFENLMIETNVIHQAWRAGVRRLLFLGSSCIYPRLAPQPIKEEYLLSGKLEPTNEPYAVAKIAGIKLCESYNRQYGTDFRCLMPTNLYGPGDNYHPQNSHVIPALIRRFHEARIGAAAQVAVWGGGTARREFLYVDDLAAASVHVMGLERALYHARTTPMQSHINVGSGQDSTIREVAEMIAQVVGYRGRIVFDTSKTDGTPRKLLDTGCLRQLGWAPRMTLEDGLAQAYRAFCREQAGRPS